MNENIWGQIQMSYRKIIDKVLLNEIVEMIESSPFFEHVSDIDFKNVSKWMLCEETTYFYWRLDTSFGFHVDAVLTEGGQLLDVFKVPY